MQLNSIHYWLRELRISKAQGVRFDHFLGTFFKHLALIFSFIILSNSVIYSQVVQTLLTSGTSYTVPVGVTSLTVECWGAGGKGGVANKSLTDAMSGSGGGGGGAYASSVISVTPGQVFPYSIGVTGYPGGSTSFNTSTVVAAGGNAGNNSVAGNNGNGGSGGQASASIGTVKWSGGNGAAGYFFALGGGGGAAGNPTSAGNPGVSSSGGIGVSPAGNGGTFSIFGSTAASNYGSGGYGVRSATISGSIVGGDGTDGLIRITYTRAINVTGTFSAFNACIGTASTAQTCSVSGSNLSGPISITPPIGFEVSTVSNFATFGTNASPLIVGAAGNLTATTIYVRTQASAGGSPSGNISFSSGTTSQTIAISGTVYNIPTFTPTNTINVCQGITAGTIAFTTTNSPTLYSLTFDASAIAAGFTSITSTAIPASPLTITIPTSATTGIYNGVLAVSNPGCVSSNVSIPVSVTSALPAISGNSFLCVGNTSDLNVAGENDWVLPTGGVVTTIGSDRIHTFTASANFSTFQNITNAKVLLVGGGGAGGTRHAGGGGAGGVNYQTGFLINAGTNAVFVGAGGIGLAPDGSGADGQNSQFTSLVASGGGGGSSNGLLGRNGGSGGGGSNGSFGGSAVFGQGNRGGNQNNGAGCCWPYGAGGGGAGNAGANTTGGVASAGGIGISNAITGTALFYAGGGGGGFDGNLPVMPGGTGGGGAGGNNSTINGTNGTPNTGGGGGGGGAAGGVSGIGGFGGSGIVIIRYTIPTWSSSNNAVATVNQQTGLVSAVGPGTAIITYTNSNGCITTKSVTVDGTVTAPTSIGGTATICAGNSTTLNVVGGTTNTDSDFIWYSGTCPADAYTNEWLTQPFPLISTTVNSLNNGILRVTSLNNDPMIDMSGLGSFNPTVNKFINIRYKVVTGTTVSAEIFFYNASHAFAVGGESVSMPLISDGVFHTLSIDMSQDLQYTTGGNITGWRFDWSSGAGVTMDIDFISLSNTPILYDGPNYTVNPSSSTTYFIHNKAACNTSACATQTITVNPLRTVGAMSSSSNTCVNTVMTAVTHATTGVTGITASSGLPAGVSASYASNLITISGTPTVAGTYNYTITPTGCGSAVATGTLVVSAIAGNPAVFGSSSWNTYGYNGANLNLVGNTYYGFYNQTNLSYDTRSSWNEATSPSFTTGYAGCPIPTDFHTVVSKRTGFPCGVYQIDISGHDSDCRLYINGTQIFEHIGCCDVHTNVWTGYLSSSSTIEFRTYEGVGNSFQWLTFTDVSSVLTGGSIGGITNGTAVCSGSDPGAFTSLSTPSGGTIGISNGSPAAVAYQWEVSTTSAIAGFTAISGETALTYNPTSVSAGSWFRRKVTDACGSIAYSNVIQVQITPNINVLPVTPGSATCINTALVPLVHSVSNVTGITSTSGLPSGVSASYASNAITISGTPSVSGTFNYTITPSGCGTATATGTITVIQTAIPSAITAATGITLATGDLVWSGAVSSNWSTYSNWYVYNGTAFVVPPVGVVPTSTSNVIILPNSTPNACISNLNYSTVNSLGNANSIFIGSGAVAGVSSGQTLAIYGDWTNNGTINESATGVIMFTGSSNQLLGGSGIQSFTNLTINKAAGHLTLNRPITVSSTLTMLAGNIVTSSTNLLTVGTSSIITGSINWTAGSIVGPLKRYYASTFNSSQTSGIFPIGTSLHNRYAQINYTSNPGGGYLVAEYKTGTPGNPPLYVGLPTVIAGEHIHNYENQGYWEITPDSYLGTMNTTPYNLVLRGNGMSTLVNANAYTRTRIIKAAGPGHTAWVAPGNHSSTTGSNSDYTIANTHITGFSWFNIGSNSGNALPVTLTSFSADCDDKSKIKLDWSTQSESNSDFYKVERSRDLIGWELVAKIQAAGNSNIPLNYSANDFQPLAGISYYRLDQVDLNGDKVTYGPISVACEAIETAMTVFPNPSQESFTVEIRTSELISQSELNVIDISGKLILKRKLSNVIGSVQIHVENHDLLPGTYFIQFVAPEVKEITPVKLCIIR